MAKPDSALGGTPGRARPARFGIAQHDGNHHPASLVGHAIPMSLVATASQRTAELDQILTYAEADRRILDLYRTNFKDAFEVMLPQHLFAPMTPVHVMNRLKGEFLLTDPLHAVEVIEPLYRMDICKVAGQVRVPVRAINSDVTPTDMEANRRHLRDYKFTPIHGTGHYPMLERPEEFNRLLDEVLTERAV